MNRLVRWGAAALLAAATAGSASAQCYTPRVVHGARYVHHRVYRPDYRAYRPVHYGSCRSYRPYTYRTYRAYPTVRCRTYW